MSVKVISQREARALRKRVDELENVIDLQRSRWSSDYPGGTHLGSCYWTTDQHVASAVSVARALNHAVVAVSDGNRKINFYALPQAKKP